MELIRYGVYWVNLDPTIGKEIKKTRPVVLVSPLEMIENLDTVLVCPMTSTIKNYPTRVSVKVEGRISSIAIDHLRSIDKSRVGKMIGKLSESDSDSLVHRLLEVFKKM